MTVLGAAFFSQMPQLFAWYQLSYSWWSCETYTKKTSEVVHFSLTDISYRFSDRNRVLLHHLCKISQLRLACFITCSSSVLCNAQFWKNCYSHWKPAANASSEHWDNRLQKVGKRNLKTVMHTHAHSACFSLEKLRALIFCNFLHWLVIWISEKKLLYLSHLLSELNKYMGTPTGKMKKWLKDVPCFT